MLRRLFPKERDFFPIFDAITVCLSDSILELSKVLDAPEKAPHSVEKAQNLQKEAERLARQGIEHLYDTLVTPFDRNHIFHLVIQLGKIVTLTRLVIEKVPAYEIKVIPLETMALAVKCRESCQILRKMVAELRKIREPRETLNLCMSIYKIKADTDELYFRASKNFFVNDADLKGSLKMMEVNNDLVSIVEKCEQISFLIEEIILEYA